MEWDMVLSGKQSNWTSFVSIPDIPDKVRQYRPSLSQQICQFNYQLTPRLVGLILLPSLSRLERERERSYWGIQPELCWICWPDIVFKSKKQLPVFTDILIDITQFIKILNSFNNNNPTAKHHLDLSQLPHISGHQDHRITLYAI